MSFKGWKYVAENIAMTVSGANDRLNIGQQLSVQYLVQTLQNSGAIIADEVSMGKTRIAVELINAVRKREGESW